MKHWRMLQFEQLGLYRTIQHDAGNGVGAGLSSGPNGEGGGPGGSQNGDGCGRLDGYPNDGRWQDAIVRIKT